MQIERERERKKYKKRQESYNGTSKIINRCGDGPMNDKTIR